MSGAERVHDCCSTHVHPPAYAEPTQEVCYEDGDHSVNRPVVRYADMAQVMCGEGELLPE